MQITHQQVNKTKQQPKQKAILVDVNIEIVG